MKALNKRLGGGLFLFFFLLPLFGRGQGGGSQPPDLQVCEGKGYTLSSAADAAGTAPVTYAWFENGTDMGSAYNTVSVSIPAGKPAGTYHYVRVASNDACTGVSSNTYTVVVNPLPTSLSLTANPTAICIGKASTLTASAAAGASYSLNNSDWQTTTTFNVTPTSNTSYTLYVQTSAGCSATKTDAAAVVANTLPATPTGASSNARCGSGAVTFSASVPGGVTIDWYNAASAGSTVSGGYGVTSFAPTISTPTTYYAQARNSTTGCVSATRLPVGATINTAPAVPTNASSNSRCNAGAVTFSATVPTGVTIDWYNAASAGSIVNGGSGVTSFAPSITTTTSYYAQARNTTTACVSTSRLQVTSTVVTGGAHYAAAVSGCCAPGYQNCSNVCRLACSAAKCTSLTPANAPTLEAQACGESADKCPPLAYANGYYYWNALPVSGPCRCVGDYTCH